MGNKANGQPGGYPRGRGLSRSGSAHSPKHQPARKILSKKITVTYDFSENGVAVDDVECKERDPQESPEQLDLPPDVREAGRRAEYEHLVDEQFCRNLTSKFARKSARKTGADTTEIQGSYYIIVLEFLARRHASPTDRKQQSLSSLLRTDYETDKALKAFLAELGGGLQIT
jgi:hypothetical protein